MKEIAKRANVLEGRLAFFVFKKSVNFFILQFFSDSAIFILPTSEAGFSFVRILAKAIWNKEA